MAGESLVYENHRKGSGYDSSAPGKKHGLSPGADVTLIDQPNGLLIVKTAGLSNGQHVVETLLRGGTIKGRTEDWLRLTRGER